MITSVRNTRVKAAAALHQRKQRQATGRFLVEGPHAVGDALADGIVEEVFVTSDLADQYTDAPGVRVEVVADHVLERLGGSRNPQGVVAVARAPQASLADVVGQGFLVVLDRIADPGNAGTVIRTADAAGAAGVVLTVGSVDPTNPKAVRAAAGSLTHLPIVTDVTLDEVVAACQQAGQRTVGLDRAGGVDIDAPDLLSPPVALIFGSEAHGFAGSALSSLDAVAAVPQFGRAESLNLAAAVAVAAYAAARRVHA